MTPICLLPRWSGRLPYWVQWRYRAVLFMFQVVNGHCVLAAADGRAPRTAHQGGQSRAVFGGVNVNRASLGLSGNLESSWLSCEMRLLGLLELTREIEQVLIDRFSGVNLDTIHGCTLLHVDIVSILVEEAANKQLRP